MTYKIFVICNYQIGNLIVTNYQYFICHDFFFNLKVTLNILVEQRLPVILMFSFANQITEVETKQFVLCTTL